MDLMPRGASWAVKGMRRLWLDRGVLGMGATGNENQKRKMANLGLPKNGH